MPTTDDDPSRALEELERRASAPEPRRADAVDRQRHLVAIVGATGGLPDVLRLSRLLLDPPLLAAAMAAIRRRLVGASCHDLLWLHERRGGATSRWSVPAPHWAAADPSDVGPVTDPWSLGLLSLHPSGYVRQAAVEALIGHDVAEALPFLLIRANDWVDPVRALASRAVSAWIEPEHAAAFATWLPLVQRLAETGRGDRGLVQRVRALLLDHPAGLRAGLASPDRFVRRAGFALALRRPDREALEAAERDTDPVVRRLGALAVARYDHPDRTAWLERLLRDRLALVRRIAVDAIGRVRDDWSRGQLLFAAVQANASVRDRAQYYLRKHHDVDLAALYREAVATPPVGPGAVLGLAEVCGPADAETLAGFLTAESARLRRAAIRGLAAVAGAEHLDAFYEALSDPSARVSHAAREAIRGRPAPLRNAALEPLMNASSPRHTRKNVLRLLATKPGWGSLASLLRSLKAADDELRAFGGRLVERWTAPTFLAPSASEIEQIEAALAELTAILPHARVRALADDVGRWRGG